MLVDSSNSNTASAVAGAIRQAASATGTSFHYLLATAQVESGLNPQAGAATSSARGLFQFVEQTWLGMMKQAGPALGYGQYADAISKDAAGHYQVSDSTMRSEILKLRNDPTVNAVMAGAFTKANAALLSEKLGRTPSEPELYIAHFLGVGGAARLITAAAADPNASAARYFPDAASANTPIFYDRSTGAARSLAQVRDVLTARYDVAARVAPERVGVTATAANTPDLGATLPVIPPLPVAATAAGAPASPAATAAVSTAQAAPDTAGMTSAFADAIPKLPAQDSDIFHGLFADPNRNGPVAAVVSQLWGVPNPAQSGNGGPPPSANSFLNLFKDNG